MAGGAGNRLWPMSRAKLPKQFQQLIGNETPFQLMVDLVRQVIPIEQIMVMAVPEFRDEILRQIPNLKPENILYEPARRDTGPAILLAMLQVKQRDPEARVATLWSDHLVLDHAAFAKVLTAAFSAQALHPDWLISVGAMPTKADPGLGYIQMDGVIHEENGVTVRKVNRFVEKPDLTTAEQYVSSGDYLWNVGYNVMAAASFLKAFTAANPDLAESVATLEAAVASNKLESIAAPYEAFPKKSIDYLLVEKLADIAVVPADMGWSDIGTWTVLHKMLVDKTGDNMVTQGEVHSINTTNSLVFAKDRPITLVGVSNLIIVDTGDTLLVMHHDAPANDLKKLVQETLSETNPELL